MKRIGLTLVVLLLLAALLAACAPISPTGTAGEETVVTLENGVVGTLNKPIGAGSAGKAPAVLMLHGFGSTRDEVGGMYARLAEALAQQGIGSLRIDFQGFGQSAGDTGATTITGQVADAAAAYDYLAGLEWVDPARLGVIGFSLGGGDAIALAGQNPEWFKSMATWSSVGDFAADMMGSVGQEAVDAAAAKGVVGLDLGWRTIVLKNDFFTSLGEYDIAGAVAQYPGAYLAVAGDQDFSAAYAPGLVEAAPGEPKEAWIIPGGDHIYGVLGEDQTMANEVIERTAQWFADTL